MNVVLYVCLVLGYIAAFMLFMLAGLFFGALMLVAWIVDELNKIRSKV